MLNFGKKPWDIEYDIAVPPVPIPFEEMNNDQAKEYFEWYMAQLPTRLEYLRERCSAGLQIPIEKLDFSSESLIYIWKWFLQVARIEDISKTEMEKIMRLPKAQLLGDSVIPSVRLTTTTKYIIRDISMYVGRCFILASPDLYWDYERRPPRRKTVSVTVNQPKVLGLKCTYKGEVSRIGFAVIHMVEVQASKISDNRQKETDLYDVFDLWMKQHRGEWVFSFDSKEHKKL